MNQAVPDAAGFVLAGGRSSRMGRDKALVEFGGRPLIAWSLGILEAAKLSAEIAGARSDLGAFARVVADEEQDKGPLSGICAAMTSTEAELAVFVSVDLPLLPASLISCLLSRSRITGSLVALCSVNGYPQPFPAVIRREAAGLLAEELHAGRLGCFAAFGRACSRADREPPVVPAEVLAQCGQVVHPWALPPALWFLNVNTSADLDRASGAFSAAHRVS